MQLESPRLHELRLRRASRGFVFLLLLDTPVDFFPVNSNVFGCANSKSNLVTFYTQHCNDDVVADHEGFTDAPCQDQHGCCTPIFSGRGLRSEHTLLSMDFSI